MTADRTGMDTQGYRIDCCELCRGRIEPIYEIPVFFHVSGQLIRRRIVRTDLCLTGENNNIAAIPIPIKVKGNSGVLLDMCQAFGIGPTVDEDRRGGFVPQEPDRRRLWHALCVNRGEPDESLITQAACNPLTKGC